MSQSLSTTYGNNILITGAETIIGTAMLGTEFGTVKNAGVKRNAAREELLNGAGNLRAIIHTNPNFEMTLEVAFEKHVTPPAIGERITLPHVGVVGRVMEGVEIKWEQGKERGLSIPVSHWDSLGDDAPFYQFNPVTEELTLLDLAAPVLSATAGALQIVLDWADIADALSYIVQVSTDAGTTWTALATPSLSTYTHTGLTGGQTRHYRARAVNAKGNGPWSNTANATALAE
jgi:hypothetical protein